MIVDDLIDTENSILHRAKYLKNAGAVSAFATHGVFSENAQARLNASDLMDQIVVTNTIPDLRTEEDKWAAVKGGLDNRSSVYLSVELLRSVFVNS